MGRPLNKRYFGNKKGSLLLGFAQQPRTPGSTVPPMKGAPAGEDLYIVEQKTPTRFKIEGGTSSDYSVPYNLTTNSDLDPSSVGFVGEFNVDGYKDDGTQVFIKKFFNRVVIYDEGGQNKRAPWLKNDNFITVDSGNLPNATATISTTATDNVSVAAPSAFIANLEVGDTVVASGVRS